MGTSKFINFSEAALSKAAQGNSHKPTSSFFKNNIPWVRLRAPKEGEAPMVIRILPGMDFSYQENIEALKASTEPFKTVDGKYTSWAQFVKGYSFFGALKTSLLSPDTLDITKHDFPRKNIDAFADLRRFIFFNSGKYATFLPSGAPTITPEEADLIKKPASKLESYKLPSKPRSFAISNILYKNPQTGEMEQMLAVFTEQMFNTLTQITEKPIPVGQGMESVSQQFPYLMFGDPTDKDTGCLLEVRYCMNPLSNSQVLTLTPSKDPKNNSRLGYQQYPITDEILQKREILCDVDDVLDIWTYRRQVDLLCKDPMFPIDLLKKAEDAGTFSNAGPLNYDLRKEGEEILERRESFRKTAYQGFSAPEGGVAMPKPIDFNKYINTPINQPEPVMAKPVIPTHTQDTAVGSLPPVSMNRFTTQQPTGQPTPAAIFGDTVKVTPQPAASNFPTIHPTPNQPVTQIPQPQPILNAPLQEPKVEKLESDITVGDYEESTVQEQPQVESDVTLARAFRSLSKEDYEVYRGLHMKFLTNAGNMTPEEMTAFFSLQSKVTV